MSTTRRPFRISTLVFLRDRKDRFLLLRRARRPNMGKWSPVGGKLDMDRGESPFECARRETGKRRACGSTMRTCTFSATSPKKTTKATTTG